MVAIVFANPLSATGVAVGLMLLPPVGRLFAGIALASAVLTVYLRCMSINVTVSQDRSAITVASLVHTRTIPVILVDRIEFGRRPWYLLVAPSAATRGCWQIHSKGERPLPMLATLPALGKEHRRAQMIWLFAQCGITVT